MTGKDPSLNLSGNSPTGALHGRCGLSAVRLQWDGSSGNGK